MYRFSLVLAAALVGFARPAAAQVVRVKNTGCPNAAYPSHNSTARIGKTLKFQWSCKAPSFAIAFMGYGSGRNIGFNQPFTCTKGPCNWYLAPFGFGYLIWPITGSSGSWGLPIPNDRRLLFSTYAIQCACLNLGKQCMDFSGALSFAIGP